MTRGSKKFLVIGCTCAWLIATAVGLSALWGYSQRAGEVGTPTSAWPAQSSLQLDPSRPTLVMFVHPKCPCSKASADQLARVMARTGDRMRVQVVAIEPVDAPAEWQSSELLRTLQRLPGVNVVHDSGGVQAKSFGARTSGHAILFDTRGRLLFSGGITPARGHEGDNAGSDAIVAAVQGGDAQAQAQTSVFGCALFNDKAISTGTN